MVDLRSLWSHFAAMSWAAFRSFAGTLLLFIAAGLILAAVSFYLIRGHTLYAWLAALLTIVEAVGLGIFAGAKRAILLGLAHGVTRVQLGSSVLRLCFERLLSVSSREPVGDRGSHVAQALERLPLAEAEQRLVQVVNEMRLDAPPGSGISGWFKRRAHRRLMQLVLTCTLAEFRQTGATEGGVDLVRVQACLGSKIDQLVVDKLKRGANALTLVLVLALALAVTLQIGLLRQLH